jgi:hypothetical protein
MKLDRESKEQRLKMIKLDKESKEQRLGRGNLNLNLNFF